MGNEAETGRRKRGGQTKDPAERKRHNLTFRVRDSMKADLEAAAQKSGRSVSEEIEFRLAQSFVREGYVEEAKAVRDTHRIQAIREAGFRIVRERGTGNTMVQLSAELLLAEADGILRSGFVLAEDVHKSPMEIMVERAVERAVEPAVERGVEKALERAGVVSAATEEPSP
jgi:TraY domain